MDFIILGSFFVVITITNSGAQLEPKNSANSSDDSLVRFCKNGTRQNQMPGSACPQGIFFKMEANSSDTAGSVTDWDCICVQGAWYLQPGICKSPGNSPLFAYGNITCFNPKEIYSRLTGGGLSYLGAWLTPKNDNPPFLLTSGLLLRPTTEGSDYIIDLKGLKCCDRENPGSDLTVLRLHPLDSWAVTRTNGFVMVCLLPKLGLDGTEERGIFGYNISMLCRGRRSGPESYLRFSHGCEYEDGNEWIDVTPFSLLASIIQSAKVTETAACTACLGAGFEAENSEDCTPADILERSELEYSVDLQSSRLGLYLQNRLLRPDEAEDDFVREDLIEIRLLTKASIIAFGACDMNLVPRPFYTYFMIMLKALLSEAFTKYPPQTALKEDSLGWIVGALDKCRLRTVPYEFIVEPTCPPSYKILKWNRKETLIDLPVRFRARPEKHDYLMEFLWKLSTFVVYYCYDEFEHGGTYHYDLRDQLESIFSEDLLLRWTNPSNSFQMYTLLFKAHFNLTVIMENFEVCVGAAHATSKYAPGIWLKKPIERPNGINWRRQKRDVGVTRDEADEDDGSELGIRGNSNGSFQCIQKMETVLEQNRIFKQNC